MAARAVTAALIAIAVAGIFGGGAGCGTQCDRNPDEPPVPYKDGIFDTAHGTYFSADVDGPFLDFPPGLTYRFFHRLGGKPQHVFAWISYAEHPSGDKQGGFVQPAGNQVTFEQVTDEYVDVRNDTCADVRIRIEASNPIASEADSGSAPPAQATDAGDAGP